MYLDVLRELVIGRRANLAADRSLLVGISGIDAGGKGYISNKLAAELESHGFRIALIKADGWLNLPHVRFTRDARRAGLHFYENALRLDEMFERLILPLKSDRSIDLTMDYADETADKYRPHRYDLTDIDIVLLEGIFIFKRQFVGYFDLKVWIDCSFNTVLARAVERNQEGLSPSDTITSYKTIYFPAQGHHTERDDPRSIADVIFDNDANP